MLVALPVYGNRAGNAEQNFNRKKDLMAGEPGAMVDTFYFVCSGLSHMFEMRGDCGSSDLMRSEVKLKLWFDLADRVHDTALWASVILKKLMLC